MERSAIAPLRRASRGPAPRQIESAASDTWRRGSRQRQPSETAEQLRPSRYAKAEVAHRKVRPPRAESCARPSLAGSLGRGKPPRQLSALGWPTRCLTRRLLLRFGFAPFRLRQNRASSPFHYASAVQNRRDRLTADPAMSAATSAPATLLGAKQRTSEAGPPQNRPPSSPPIDQSHLCPSVLRAWPPVRPVPL